MSDARRLIQCPTQPGRARVLVTLKADGRPQLSNVSHHYDPAARIAARLDHRHAGQDPQSAPRSPGELSRDFADFYEWAVAEGTATLSEVAARPDDAAVDELVALYREIAGEHPDWDEYRQAMVADKRLVMRLAVERFYGQVP